MGIDHFKDIYENDGDFVDIHKVCVEYKNNFHSRYVEYTLQSDLISFSRRINFVFIEALLERI